MSIPVYGCVSLCFSFTFWLHRFGLFVFLVVFRPEFIVVFCLFPQCGFLSMSASKRSAVLTFRSSFIAASAFSGPNAGACNNYSPEAWPLPVLVQTHVAIRRTEAKRTLLPAAVTSCSFSSSFSFCLCLCERSGGGYFI